MSMVCRFSLIKGKENLPQMSTQGKLVVKKGQNLDNVGKECPIRFIDRHFLELGISEARTRSRQFKLWHKFAIDLRRPTARLYAPTTYSAVVRFALKGFHS